MVTLYQVAKLYVATFNRAPDQAGLLYWVNTSGLSLEGIAESFFDQAETQTLYPVSTNLSTFVTAVYDNLFNHLPDSEGLTYWINQLQSGMISKHHFILAVINGAQNTAAGQDATILENKTSVGLSFANAGLNDTQHATNLMNDIDATQQSVSEALSQINDWSNPLHSEALNHSKIDLDVGTLSNFSTFGVAALNSGYYWENDIVTYSFNTFIPDEYYEAYDYDLIRGWESFTASMRSAVNQMSSGLNEFFGIRLQYVTSNGDIRYNVVESEWGGFAYYPMEMDSIDGDVFISTDIPDDSELYPLSAGGSGWNLIAHELGHALGLKHPFEDGAVLPDSLDNSAHTIMSYTDYNRYTLDATINAAGYIQLEYIAVNPYLYSLYDVSALQAIYGVNLTTRTEDNIYSVSIDSPAYITIWDAGGEDLIDCSDATGECVISLEDRTLNSADIHSLYEQRLSMQSWAHLQGDHYGDTYIAEVFASISESLYTGENNLAIAVGVIIENLYTGSGNDTVWDNEVDNHIVTGGGDDSIYLGNGGWDIIDGGDGTDTVYLDSLRTQMSIAEFDTEQYRLIGDDFAVDLIGIERISFADGSISSLEILV